MADHTPAVPAELGADMDYSEHERTYKGFLMLAKYGSLVLPAILIAIAFPFRRPLPPDTKFQPKGLRGGTARIHPS